MLLLAMCRPGGQAPSDPRPPALANRHADGLPKRAWRDGLRAASGRAARHPRGPGRVRRLLPAPVMPGCPPDLGRTTIVVLTAVSFFACSYESCIIIIIIVTSVSLRAARCCAAGPRRAGRPERRGAGLPSGCGESVVLGPCFLCVAPFSTARC